jgi:RNA polymerase primary sigma factor
MRQLKITKSITHLESRSLELYFQDIAKEPLVTSEEEVLLAQRIRNGDKQALDQLCRAHLRFVVSVAKQYQNQGLSLPDLINDGNAGLVKAANRFDEKRGFKFISYAVWWIRQSILISIAENSRMVRLPLNKIGILRHIKNATNELEQKLHRFPSHDEIAEYLEIPIHKFEEYLKISTKHISMDAPLYDESDETLIDLFVDEKALSTDNELVNESLSNEIKQVLSTLTKEERDVINLHYGIGFSNSLSLEEIGWKFDISRAKVSRIKKKALHKLKHTSRMKILIKYLG